MSWTFVGNVVYVACQWAMLVALARLGSPETVGRFSFGFAVTAPIMLFASLKLRSAQATDAEGEYGFSDYLALRLVMTALALVAVAAVITGGGYRGESAGVIAIIAIAKAVELLSDALYGLMQRQQRLDLIAQSLMLKGLLSLIALFLAFTITRSLIWALIALTITWLTVLTGFDTRCAARCLAIIDEGTNRMFRPRWDCPTLWSLAKLTIPLGALTFVGSLSSNVPRYFVERRLGEYELGLFSAILYLKVAGNLVTNALGQSATPHLANLYAAGKMTAFRVLVLKLMLGGTLVGGVTVLMAALAGRQLLLRIFGEEYAMRSGTLTIVAFAFGLEFAYVSLGTAATAMRRFKVQLPIHLASLAALGLLCMLLVDRRGASGAAWAMVGSSAVEASLYGFVILRLIFPSSRPKESPNGSGATRGEDRE